MAHLTEPELGRIREGVSLRVPTILVVDDDPRFLSRMRNWLDDQGFQVICKETGKSALSTVQSTPVDVALVDYRLRGREDGLSLATTLSREHRIPFILVSGFLSTRVTVQAMRVGAADVLDKPLIWTSGAFPCPLCLVPLRVRSSKKGKPYVVCDACGVQMFVRAKPGIARLASLMAKPEVVEVIQRLATVSRQQKRTCLSCRHPFWLSEAELQTHWFNGAFVGYKCPSCGALAKPEPEKRR